MLHDDEGIVVRTATVVWYCCQCGQAAIEAAGENVQRRCMTCGGMFWRSQPSEGITEPLGEIDRLVAEGELPGRGLRLGSPSEPTRKRLLEARRLWWCRFVENRRMVTDLGRMEPRWAELFPSTARMRRRQYRLGRLLTKIDKMLEREVRI
jgi:hypothetical protein